MKSLKDIENYFLGRFNPDGNDYFQARLLVKFILVCTAFAVIFWVGTFYTGFVTGRYLMLVCILVYSLQLFAIRKGASRKVVGHAFVFFSWVLITFLAVCSGRLYSSSLAWITLVPTAALLMMGGRAGLFWGAVGIVTVLVFFFTEPLINIPESWKAPQSDLRTTTLYVGLIAMLFSMTYLFYRQGARLLAMVRAQKGIIEDHNDEIAARNESLEEEVNKRTRELLDYNQQLEQFAFIASHNLRAPVASLLGLGNLMEVSLSNKEDIEQICLNMMNTARELDRVVRDLSTILEIRKTSHAPLAKIILDDEVHLVKVSLEREILETRADLRIDFSEVPSVMTVRPLMDSILMNLISNAIKYRHPDRAPRISLSTTRIGGEICLMVSDNGLGMDLKEYGDKVFTLYGRFHSHVDGKGLGLYLVKTHVIAMGGRIEVESKLGVGSTFRVFLRYQAGVSESR